MATKAEAPVEPRIPLTRDRILGAAIDLADRGGIESVSMRKVGQELGVEAMSLYNHVANKGEMLAGMVDVVMSEIELSPGGPDWKTALRNQVMSARRVMAHHPWAAIVIEGQNDPTPTLMAYFDSIVGIMRQGGFSYDLIHHGMHALGSRALGFSQELFDDSDPAGESPEVAAAMIEQMIQAFPNMSAMMQEITHEDETVVGQGCDDNIEFTFALDLILDGLDRLRTYA